MSFQYIRDIQMAIGYDWRLINKKLYNQLIMAAIRTAYAMEHKWIKEFMPVNGVKQPLYRMWYTMGIDRLLQIADILIRHEHEVFTPLLYLAEQEGSIMNMAKDSEVARTDKTVKTIDKFKPVLEDKENGGHVKRIHEQLDIEIKIFPSWAEWTDGKRGTLIGNAIKLVKDALTPSETNNPDDKLIVYANNDDLLSYFGLILQFSLQILPFKINSRKRFDEKNKGTVADLSKKDPSIEGRAFYVHAKSAYIGVESALISYFKYVPNVRVLLITYNKGGMGLNLQVANREIFLTSSQHYTEQRQARDRVYRNNQKKPVFIHHMAMAIEDIPIYHPLRPGVKTAIVKGEPKLPGQIQEMKLRFDWMKNEKNIHWRPNEQDLFGNVLPYNEMWHHSMYFIASEIIALFQEFGESNWKNIKEVYDYVSQNPLMSAHQLVTKARTQWQLAHRQFYPLHSYHNAANPQQTQNMAFKQALFEHRLSVLLALE